MPDVMEWLPGLFWQPKVDRRTKVVIMLCLMSVHRLGSSVYSSSKILGVT